MQNLDRGFRSVVQVPSFLTLLVLMARVTIQLEGFLAQGTLGTCARILMLTELESPGEK